MGCPVLMAGMKGKNMNKFQTLFFGAILATGAATQALAEDIYVIANSNTTVTANDIREIFLGEKQFAGAVKLVPVDNAAAQTDFLGKVMKMDVAKYSATWTKKSFRDGLNPPATKSGDLEVLGYVKSTPGAVGYVISKPSNVTVIQKY